MTSAIESELISILSKLKMRPTGPNGVLLDDAEIGQLSLDQIDVDSLTYLEVMYRIEEKYDVEFGSVSVATFSNLREIANAVEEQLTMK